MKEYLKFLILYILFFFSITYSNAQIDHWEMIVNAEDIWHYFPGNSQPPNDWKNIEFDDSGWFQGQGGIGYGDDDDLTVIEPVVSLYMRKYFTIVDTASLASLGFYMDYDDAFIAYINGVEIARSGMYDSDPSYDMPADLWHEATMYMGGIPEQFLIDPLNFKDLIKQGENILAIQVHNQDISSSDLSAIPFLLAGISNSSNNYMEIPDWFLPPVQISESILPIFKINTFGQGIQDENRIRAELGIINNPEGMINHVQDTFTDYHGWINMEIRGESSTMFPKKSYSFETQDSTGANNNVSLLGFPEENDWILYAPFSDKTLIKNVLSMHLARIAGRYASRTSYVELFINEEYKGLYVLMEKIKRDKGRVDIATLNPEDITGDQLTGGYIIRVDKIDPNDYPPWQAYPQLPLYNEDIVNYEYYDPDGWELQPEQQDYIRGFMRKFEFALSGTDFIDQENGYRAYIDMGSFVDYFILMELSKNIDAYIFSTYLYKDRDSKGGKLNMGPVWDFNIGFGNLDYNEMATRTSGWMYDEDYRIYWYRRMMKDYVFRNQLSCRWHDLRSGPYSDDNIFGFIDSLVSSIKEPIVKNYQRWPVLDTYVWPNSFIGMTYDAEVQFLKSWLKQRLLWMDTNIPFTCITGITPAISDITAFPNPFNHAITFNSKFSGLKINILEIFDLKGKLVFRHDCHDGCQSYEWEGVDNNGQVLPSGHYFGKLILSSGELQVQQVIKY